MPGIIAPFPAVEGLGRYIEVTAGKPGIVAVGIVSNQTISAFAWLSLIAPRYLPGAHIPEFCCKHS